MRANARSAVVSTSTPGVLPAGMPRAVSSGRSRLSVPTPAFDTTRSRGAASSKCASTRSVVIDSRPSARLSRGTSWSRVGAAAPAYRTTSTCSASRSRPPPGNAGRVTTTTRLLSWSTIRSSSSSTARAPTSGWDLDDPLKGGEAEPLLMAALGADRQLLQLHALTTPDAFRRGSIESADRVIEHRSRRQHQPVRDARRCPPAPFLCWAVGGQCPTSPSRLPFRLPLPLLHRASLHLEPACREVAGTVPRDRVLHRRCP